jgi:hypothetical protein
MQKYETPSQPTSQIWWDMSVFPAMKEAIGRRIVV